ncbi:MAG: hypothetical protein P1P81_08160 [Desulfobulbales bacterium]|nr:hypothetical protein [Desulfobulbales bacterium]
MKALTIWPPFASLIGVKTIESRGWATNHRVELLICSARQGTHLSALFYKGGLVPAVLRGAKE